MPLYGSPLYYEYPSHRQIVVSFVLVVYSLYIAIFNVYTFHGYTLITQITHGGEQTKISPTVEGKQNFYRRDRVKTKISSGLYNVYTYPKQGTPLGYPRFCFHPTSVAAIMNLELEG